MADLPGLERTVGIQPVDTESDVGKTLNEFASTIEPQYNAVANFAASWGMQVAQNASNEQARLDGIQAAKNPGQKFLPAFGESDAEFLKSYRYEVKQNSLFEANKLLSSLGTTALQSPSSQSLAEYAKNAQSGIGKILSQVDASDKPDMERELMTSYLGNYQKIEGAVRKKNQEFMVANRSALMSQRAKNIQNFALDGNVDLAEAEYQNGIAAINQGEELFKSGSPVGISSDDAEIQRTKLREMYLIANTQGQAQIAAKEGRTEQYLADLRDRRPEGISATEHEMIIRGAGTYLNQYEAALSGQRQINYIGYDAEISNGKMTPDRLDEIRQLNDVSEIQMAKLEANYSSVSAKEQKQVALFNVMNGQSDDPVAMANYSPGNINDLFSARMAQLEQSQNAQPGELGVQGQTIVAQGIRAPVEAYQSRMEAGINSGDPETMAIWSQAMIVMNKNNPAGLKGLSKDARSVANLYDAYSSDTKNKGQDAANKALNDVYNVDEATKTARIDKLKQWNKDKGLNNLAIKNRRIANGIGAHNTFTSNSLYPDRLTTRYDELMPSYITRNPSAELAEKELFEDMKQVYKPTNTNNREEIMNTPPDSVLPNWKNWDQNDKARALKEYVDSVKELEYNGGFVLNKVDWKNAPDTSNLLTDKPLVKGDLIIQVDGKDRKVIIVSDDVTIRSPDGRPSWAFQFLDDNGVPQPLLDSTANNSQARWRPDYERLEVEKKKYPMLQIQKAQQAREEFLTPEESVTAASQVFLRGID